MSPPEPLERIAAILRNVAQEIRPCRSCGKQLAFLRHRNGLLTPYTFEGLNHFIDCPAAIEFRRQNMRQKSLPTLENPSPTPYDG